MNINLHFNIDAIPDRKLITSKIYGIWTLDTARDYHDEFKEVVGELNWDKWAKLVNLSNWKSSYPEMIKIIGQHMKWSRENGMALSIYVIDDPVTLNQLKKMIAIGEIEDINYLVRSLEEAEKILAEHGF